MGGSSAMNDDHNVAVPNAFSWMRRTWKVSAAALEDEDDLSLPETSALTLHRRRIQT